MRKQKYTKFYDSKISKYCTCARATCQPGQMSQIQKRPYKKAFKPKNQMVLYKRPKYVSLTNPPTKPMKPEKKNYDAIGSTGNVAGANTWSEIDHINPISTGVDASSRIGRKVQMKSVQLRWVTSTSTFNNPVRIAIIYDKSPQGQLPSVTEIWGVDNFNALSVLANSERFIMLADEVHNANFTVGSTNVQQAGTLYRKINLPAMWSGTTSGAITSQTEGAVYVMSSVLANVGAGIGYNSRIRYTDL